MTDAVDSVGLHAAGELGWLLPVIKTLADANAVVTEMMTPGLVGPEDLYFRWKLPQPKSPGPSPAFDDGSKENSAALLKFQTDTILSRPEALRAILEALSATV